VQAAGLETCSLGQTMLSCLPRLLSTATKVEFHVANRVISHDAVWSLLEKECRASLMIHIQDHHQLEKYVVKGGIPVDDQPKPVDLLKRLRSGTSLRGVLPNKPDRTPVLSFLDVCVTEPGLRYVVQSPVPRGFLRFDNLEDESTAGWTISAPGSVTPPHIDDCGMPSIIHHLFGKKMWLLWPATAENRSKWEEHLEAGRFDGLCHALGGLLDGLQVCLLDRPGWFYIPPGCIHSVITFTVSAHVKIGVICPCDLQPAQDAAKWYSEWLYKARHGLYLRESSDKERLAGLHAYFHNTVFRLMVIARYNGWADLKDWKDKVVAQAHTL
jgi:hypothetical protein